MHQLFVGQLLVGMRELAAQAMLEHGELRIEPVLGVQRRHVLLGAVPLTLEGRARSDDRHPPTEELRAVGFRVHEPEEPDCIFLAAKRS